MKSSGFIKRFVSTALLSLGAVSGAFAQLGDRQILVGGTDFDPINPTEENAFIGVDKIKMTGVLGGTLEVYGTQPSDTNDIGYDYDSKGNAVASTFHDSELVAITKNPKMLDSLHYIDDKNGDWGVVWSRFRGTSNKTILSYSVNGLKPNSSVRVVIKYRSVIDPEADGYDKLKCSQSGSQRTNIRVAENPDKYNLTEGQDATQIGHGESGTYDNSNVMGAQASAGRADDEGSFFLNVNMTSKYMGQNCVSIEITSIEVYGTVDPKIYSEEGETVCAGEFATVNLRKEYQGAQYQWYSDDKAITGATSPNYSFETSASEKTYNLQLKVTYDGMAFSSNKVTIKTEKCCEIINEAGDIVSASRKIVFKEDFGEFDLSDKTGKTYKVWDYSDIANPVQITKKTTTPFRYELDYNPLGCTFQGKGPLVDAEYTVAGLLTGYNGPYEGMDGAKLEWAADLHGVMKRDKVFHFDHSGKPEGCCLFVNCKDETAGQNIYEREITNLCENRQVSFECYITIFTASAAGAYNPVDVTLRATEIGNITNVVEKRATQTIPADGGTGDWVKLSGQIYLEKGDGIKLEIVNNVNTDQNGNDLVIDDIIVRTCAAPSLQAYFDTVSTTNVTTCDGGDITIYANPTEILTKYFGSTNTRYLYQWTLTPDDKKSWKNIGDPTDKLEMEAGSTPFANLQTEDKVYFRVIAGSDYTLSTTKDEDYNVDDPCAAYSISAPIEALKRCVNCTNESPDAVFRKPNTEFCEGEGTGLIDMTLTEGTMSDYTIHWWKGTDTLTATSLGDDKDTKFFENLKSEESGIFTYQLVDNTTGCAGEIHNFEVIINAIPDAPKDENIQYTISEDSSYILTTEKFAQTLDASYNLIWFLSETEPNPKGSKSVEIDRSVATTDPYVFYIAYKDGDCYSKRAKVEVIVSPLDNIKSIATDNDDEIVNVYTVSGALVKANVKKSEALRGLSNGSYIVGDQKVIVK